VNLNTATAAAQSTNATVITLCNDLLAGTSISSTERSILQDVVAYLSEDSSSSSNELNSVGLTPCAEFTAAVEDLQNSITFENAIISLANGVKTQIDSYKSDLISAQTTSLLDDVISNLQVFSYQISTIKTIHVDIVYLMSQLMTSLSSAKDEICDLNLGPCGKANDD
jgi:hypothetical protein